MATATEERTHPGTGVEMEPAEGDTITGDGSGQALPELSDPDGQALFDRSRYQDPELRIDQVDGQEVDKIWIAFKGRVGLDRTKAEDVALFNRLRLGKELELQVSGKGVAVGTKKTTSRGGDLDAVVGERVLEIDTVYVLSPEELAA